LVKRKNLAALDIVATSEEPMTVSNWWQLEYLFRGFDRFTEQSFGVAVAQLKEAGLLIEDSKGLSFAGDELDRILIKYMARQKGVYLRNKPIPFEIVVFDNFWRSIKAFAVNQLGALQTADYVDDVSGLMQFIDASESDVDALQYFQATPIVEDLLSSFFKLDEGEERGLFEFFISSEHGSIQLWFLWNEPHQKATLKKFDDFIESMSERATHMGFLLRKRFWEMKVPLHYLLVRRVIALGNDQLTTRLSGTLMDKILNIYVDDRDVPKARRFASTAFAMSGSRLTPDANNIGYLYMAGGDFDEAKLWFEAARQYSADPNDAQVLHYNLGVLAAIKGELVQAKEQFVLAKRSMEGDAVCACRLLLEDGKLRHEEILHPKSVASLVDEGLKVLEELSSASVIS
jgi:hypothetical protein